jgi:hypothetical protein
MIVQLNRLFAYFAICGLFCLEMLPTFAYRTPMLRMRTAAVLRPAVSRPRRSQQSLLVIP